MQVNIPYMDPMGKNLWDVMGSRNHLFWVWCFHRRGRWILRVEMIHERPSLTQNFDMPFDWLVEVGILIMTYEKLIIELASPIPHIPYTN